MSEVVPPWWDRDVDDESGHLLRADVRESAHRVWKSVWAQARRLLGDAADAPELLESAVKAVSRYLDKNHAPLHASDPGGLLVLACYRSLRRLTRKRGRIELLGGSSELAEILRAPDWSHEVDRRLLLERLAAELNAKTRAILRLRISGHDWKEIARMLHMTATAARTSFWRDVRKAHLRFLRAPEAKNCAPKGDEG
jgi:DNA-directed RNA polymerase specialized sigma24 family protein